jgi:hypothetical protein
MKFGMQTLVNPGTRISEVDLAPSQPRRRRLAIELRERQRLQLELATLDPNETRFSDDAA